MKVDIDSSPVKKSPQGFVAATVADPISSGLAFLSQNQGTGGSWSQSGKGEFAETAAVMRVLQFLDQRVGASSTEQGRIDTMLPAAGDSIMGMFPETSDYLAQKATLLARAGNDVTSLSEYLFAQINGTDFGFGAQRDYVSDLITSAAALEALTASGYTDPGSDPDYTKKALLLYLILKQNSDGGWPELAGGASSILATDGVLRALFPYRALTIVGLQGGDITIAPRLANGLKYLQMYEYYDGSWRNNPLLTGFSFATLLDYGMKPYRNGLLERATTWLTGNQNADGSFGNPSDAMATAYALLGLSQPDITVSDIQNLYPAEGPVAGVRASVVNVGYITSLPLNLSASPAAFRLEIDGQDIPLDMSGLPPAVLLESGAAAIFDIEFSAPLFGAHEVKFLADYASPELYGDNNTLLRTIQFNAPQFLGPKPPPRLGAATAPVPGDVILRWALPTDVTRSYFAIYASTQPGVYDDNNPAIIFPPGDYVGIQLTISPSSFYGVPIYFAVASFDNQGVRGPYSSESMAIAYADPEAARGTLSGRVTDQVTGAGLPNAGIEFYFVDNFSADGSGNYSINYYPGNYLTTVSSPDYYYFVGLATINAQSATTANFALQLWNVVSPPQLTGIIGRTGDRTITWSWDPYSMSPTHTFSEFRVYRSTRSEELSNPTSSLLRAAITDPLAVSFVDDTIENNLGYYYRILAVDDRGTFSANSQYMGPVRGNSAPRVSNLVAAQEQGNINISYDLSDAEQGVFTVSFDYWDGGAWRGAQTTVGEGNQSAGSGRVGIWNVRQDVPNFEGEIKLRVVAFDGEWVNERGEAETGMFSVDTRSPATPTLASYPPVVTEPQYRFSGIKEAGASIRLDGNEAVPVNEDTTWGYVVLLREGENTFTFTSRDAFANESAPVSVSITYTPPVIGGRVSPPRMLIDDPPCEVCEEP